MKNGLKKVLIKKRNVEDAIQDGITLSSNHIIIFTVVCI